MPDLVGPFACAAVITIADAILIRLLAVQTYADATEFGALVGIEFLTPMVVDIAIDPLFPRPFLYSAINAPYFIVGNTVACLVLTAIA